LHVDGSCVEKRGSARGSVRWQGEAHRCRSAHEWLEPRLLLTDVVAAAAGSQHSLAVRTDGTVWAWGANWSGQLGDGTTQQRTTPGQVSGLTNAAAVAAGYIHSLVLGTDGTVWAWGGNPYGQLGDGTTQLRTTPEEASGLTNVAAVAAGYYHSFAVGRASPTQGTESFTASLPAGATVTTDVESDGATATDPVETTLTTPVAGTVSVNETASQLNAGDFSVAGRLVEISAPAATAADPLVIRFRIDASAFPPEWSLSSLSAYRNGASAAACTGPGATPDPCVESRTRMADDDVEIVIRTSQASDWVAGRASPTADAGGPYTVVEGSSVVLDATGSGGEAPLSYRWTGTGSELSDSETADPRFTGRDDATLTLNLAVTDVAGLTGSVDTTVTVTNSRPSVTPFVVDKNTQRRVQISAAFADRGLLDTHAARVQWGDGTESSGVVGERNGLGAVVASHQYALKGTYKITLTVGDDDGGEGTVQRQLTIL
jgi:Regulator of chromosome condensation (RCC1) repeat/PKD domain